MEAPLRPSKILQRMLERLHASLANGPLLSCRPHSSRQRIDLMQLGALDGSPPDQILPSLLNGDRPIRLKPKDDDVSLVSKLRTIAEDAKTYEQDTGVHALFVGYPMLHLPPEPRAKSGTPGKRILAPIAFVPVQLAIRTARPASVTISCAADGSDRVVPNAALFAWLQQLTGHSFDALFADEDGADPWREINELTAAVGRALELAVPEPLDPSSPLLATPRSDGEDPQVRAVLASAVLGLYPVSKQGLVNDLSALAAGEPPGGPLQSFLASDRELGLASENPEVQHRVASERCVGPADPCQLRAVRLARRASGLVIHGPPGTGKSQTITNIIADHLAAGERVLFVCDKRTALEVVHHRLEHVGLGKLCAVVHDARRDPRELYRAIREQLDALPDAPRDPAAGPQLEAADRELTRLHDELAQYTSAIMDRPDSGGAESLHELMGRWYGLTVPDRWASELTDVRVGELPELERDCREMLARGQKEHFAANPWTAALGIELRAYLDQSPAYWQRQLRALETAAKTVDDATGSELLPFEPNSDLAVQARARTELQGLLDDALAHGCGAQLASWADKSAEEQANAAREHAAIAPAAQVIAREPLDRELAPAADGGESLALPELALSLGKLANYLEIEQKWYRFVFFRRRREAREVVQRFGFALGYEVASRVHAFLSGLRARRVVHAWYRALGGDTATPLPEDSRLTAAVAERGRVFRILSMIRETPGLAPAREAILASLREVGRQGALATALRASERRAEALQTFQLALDAAELLGVAFRRQTFRDACAHEPVHAEIASLSAQQSSIEGILRIRERLARLPEAARVFQLRLLEESADPASGWAAVQKAVLSAEIARRLRSAPVLHELDADRIRATYARYRAVEARRRELASRAILQRWNECTRARLLSATGGRLNSTGAEVRRRLVSRGERALRLRQAIATGANIEGGDPLFDLRPVWLTSPEVVAQVFPRTALFDLVVFDEASQCRLEEALPVLTRARRVVIAGDPKQLPPTRFFELASGQSAAEIEAETEQELFEEQQIEVEDLLGAALNLAIEQSYLDVHYRSQNADLIQFSNHNFYEGRLQPIPAHPSSWRAQPPLRLVHAGGVYDKRANPREADAVVRIVRELLGRSQPPSIGIACFNLTQRDVIVEALDRAAAEDPVFGAQLSAARARRGEASFEGLFVKNLENVQGDERDQIIVSTTYGPDPAGRFYRRFGPLGMPGGGRRLNVLVTRAREAVHIVTSIPREIYTALPALGSGQSPNGAWLLFAYLRYADGLAQAYGSERERRRAADRETAACRVLDSESPSELAQAVGRALAAEHALSSEVHWGNEGFGVDIALSDASAPDEVTLGVLCDATRFEKAPDRVQWDIFRSEILETQGWNLVRLWTPQFFRRPAESLEMIAEETRERAAATSGSGDVSPAVERRPEDPLTT